MDIVVLGGGVVGVTSAWYLAKAGHKVTLLEQELDGQVARLPGGLFQRLYGLDGARLAQVFPGARPRDIGLV